MFAKKELYKNDPKDYAIVAIIHRVKILEDGKSRGSGGNTTARRSSDKGDDRDTPGFPRLSKWIIYQNK